MADASNHTLQLVKEATWGITPAPAAYRAVRHTGTTLAISMSSAVSDEILPSRMIADVRMGSQQTGGDISWELSYGGTFIDLITAALMSAPAAEKLPQSIVRGMELLQDADGYYITMNPDSVDVVKVFGFPCVGDYLHIADDESDVKITKVVRPKNADDAGFEDWNACRVYFESEPPVDVDGGTTLAIKTQRIKAGTTRQPFTFLRHFADIADAKGAYHRFYGSEINTFTLSAPADGVVTGSFAIVGKGMEIHNGKPNAGDTFGSPVDTPMMQAIGGRVEEGGEAICIATEISLTLENGIEPRFVICEEAGKEGLEPSIGKSNTTAQLTCYFEDSAMLQKYLKEETSSLVFTLKDPLGNAYRIGLPKIKYTGGQPDVPSSGSITLAMPVQALFDKATGTSLWIDFVPAPETT